MQDRLSRTKLLRRLMWLAILALLVGCNGFFVSPDALVSLTLSPSNGMVQPGKTQQFTASGKFGDNSVRDVSSKVSWSSSSTSVATIDNTGLATGVALGTTTITGSDGSVKATTTLTVSNQTLSSITIAPGSAQLTAGQSQQFTATATFSDNSTRNITTSATWTSSNPSVVTVSSTGLATVSTTAFSGSSATISVSSGSITATATISVF